MVPPPMAVTKPTTYAPNQSNRLAEARRMPLMAKANVPINRESEQMLAYHINFISKVTNKFPKKPYFCLIIFHLDSNNENNNRIGRTSQLHEDSAHLPCHRRGKGKRKGHYLPHSIYRPRSRQQPGSLALLRPEHEEARRLPGRKRARTVGNGSRHHAGLRKRTRCPPRTGDTCGRRPDSHHELAPS